LKTLSASIDRLGRLEGAVYGGRGADEWVIAELGLGNGVEGERNVEGAGSDGLAGTKIMRAVQVNPSCDSSEDDC
jgi:hypothetical protein